MSTTFEVHGKQYRAEVRAAGKPEGEKFDLYRVTVSGQKSGAVEGTMKLTTLALQTAEERAREKGGSKDEWVARAVAKSLASEVLIRKLQPEFSFVVDHRWV